MRVLYLNERDMINAGVEDMYECISAMEKMFVLLSKDDFRMSGKNHNDHGARVTFPENTDIPNMPTSAPDRWFSAMPAYLGGEFHAFGIKSYGGNHENSKRNLPYLMLMMQLLDVDSGAPLAYMSANLLSSMRTGAVAGVGAKYLSPRGANTVSILGPGVQSLYALKAILVAQPDLKNLKVLGRGKDSLDKFIREVKNDYDLEIQVCKSVEELYSDADIVFTGNSRANSFDAHPFCDEKWIKPGSLVIASSAVRYNRDYLNSDDVFLVADDDLMYEDGLSVDGIPVSEEAKKTVTVNGFINESLKSNKKIVNIGDIINSNDKVDRSCKNVFYGAYGLPTEDVAWAYICYQNALKKGIGTWLDL
ncbi:MAG: ornithine cyclodeaminase [Lachnospiraceae bacterium]|nr:ornithine cyclodeaminase [Lachnospiraceae bacterium]